MLRVRIRPCRILWWIGASLGGEQIVGNMEERYGLVQQKRGVTAAIVYFMGRILLWRWDDDDDSWRQNGSEGLLVKSRILTT